MCSGQFLVIMSLCSHSKQMFHSLNITYYRCLKLNNASRFDIVNSYYFKMLPIAIGMYIYFFVICNVINILFKNF